MTEAVDTNNGCRLWFSEVADMVTRLYSGEHKVATLAHLKPWDTLQVPKPQQVQHHQFSHYETWLSISAALSDSFISTLRSLVFISLGY